MGRFSISDWLVGFLNHQQNHGFSNTFSAQVLEAFMRMSLQILGVFVMEPENDSSQKGISSSRGLFSGSMLVFGGVVLFCLAGVITIKQSVGLFPGQRFHTTLPRLMDLMESQAMVGRLWFGYYVSSPEILNMHPIKVTTTWKYESYWWSVNVVT